MCCSSPHWVFTKGSLLWCVYYYWSFFVLPFSHGGLSGYRKSFDSSRTIQLRCGPRHARVQQCAAVPLTFRKNLGIPRTVGGGAFSHAQCFVAWPCVMRFQFLAFLSSSRSGLEWLLYLDVFGAAAVLVASFCTVYPSSSKCVLVLM